MMIKFLLVDTTLAANICTTTVAGRESDRLLFSSISYNKYVYVVYTQGCLPDVGNVLKGLGRSHIVDEEVGVCTPQAEEAKVVPLLPQIHPHKLSPV